MTKKDYKIIAGALKDVRVLCETEEDGFTLDRVCLFLAGNLYQDNPALDHEKFLDACGYTVE